MRSIHTEILSNGVSFEMIYIEGETFDMGSEGRDAYRWEKPVHKVGLDSFYMGKFPVTQAVWKAVMGTEHNPSFYHGDLRPVETVSWENCEQFIQRLNEETGKNYRLPFEAEWEYAARGGWLSQRYLYAGSDKLNEVGWYVENSDRETKDVGLKHPNELGLYDMSGNVWEWCQDWYSEEYYQACFDQGIVKNPIGAEKSDDRVIRGGSWSGKPLDSPSTDRRDDSPGIRFNDLGLRLVLTPSIRGGWVVNPCLPVSE